MTFSDTSFEMSDNTDKIDPDFSDEDVSFSSSEFIQINRFDQSFRKIMKVDLFRQTCFLNNSILRSFSCSCYSMLRNYSLFLFFLLEIYRQSLKKHGSFFIELFHSNPLPHLGILLACSSELVWFTIAFPQTNFLDIDTGFIDFSTMYSMYATGSRNDFENDSWCSSSRRCWFAFSIRSFAMISRVILFFVQVRISIIPILWAFWPRIMQSITFKLVGSDRNMLLDLSILSIWAKRK